MRKERQVGFRGGELGLNLRGKTSAVLYEEGAALLRNWLVTSEGDAVNRPGWQLIGEVKSSADIAHRLVPFIFGGGQDYVLEFGPLYVRIHQAGSYNIAEVVTTYTAGDLATLKYNQTGDVVLLTVANKPPREFKRIGHTNWTISDWTPVSSLAAPTGLAFQGGSPAASDANHPGKIWDVTVTAFSGGDTPEESLESNVISYTTGQALYNDKPATYQWAGVTGAAGYAIYRGQNGRRGYIGSTKGQATVTFRDDGQIPLYAEPPPLNRNPFSGATINDPQVSAYHALRLWFFNSLAAPSTAWSTRLAAFKSLDAAEPPRDDDAITLTLAVKKFDEIRSALPLGDFLYLFGSNAEWLLGGVQGAAPTPSNSPVIPMSYWGSSWLDPVVVGDVPLFVTDMDNHLRELLVGAPYQSRDLSLVAGHLFKRHSVLDLTYARTPFSTVYLVRDDGVLLTVSYIKEIKQVAWSQQVTAGTVENVCSIPGSGEDDVFVLVKRTVNGATKRYIERQATRSIKHIREFVGLDSSVYFNGTSIDGSTVTVTGNFGVGQACTITSSTPKFAGSDVNDEVVLHPVKSGGDIRIRISAFTSSTVVSGQVIVAVPAADQGVATSDWAFGRKVFSALTHLQNVTIQVLADGVVIDGLTVVAGVVTLATPAVHVIIGRHYDSDMGLLDLSSTRAKNKNVANAYFEVVETARTGLQVGEKLTSLNDWDPPPEITADFTGFISDPAAQDAPVYARIGIDATWNPHGAAYLRQSKPLPVTVLAITRELADAEG